MPDEFSPVYLPMKRSAAQSDAVVVAAPHDHLVSPGCGWPFYCIDLVGKANATANMITLS
jgi:hypothetical protein